MEMFLYILAAVVFYGILDLKPAIKSNEKKYIFIYLTMSTAVLVTWILLARGVQLPSPNEPIKHAVEAIFGPQG